MNYIIQIIWICAYTILGAVTLLNNEFMIWLMFLSFFLGLNHVVVSLVDVVVNRAQANFKYHFIGSLAYLAVLLFGYVMEEKYRIHIPEGGIIGDLIPVLGVGIPIVLAIYFWYLSLKDGYPYTKRDHDVFEL